MKHRFPAGFTLIEVMLVTTITGIFATVALPAYQRFTTRARISEVVIAGDGCKIEVQTAYASQSFPDGNRWPCQTDSNAPQSHFVSGVSVDKDGVISVKARHDAPGLAEFQGATL